jgi:hypothetical protein
MLKLFHGFSSTSVKYRVRVGAVFSSSEYMVFKPLLVWRTNCVFPTGFICHVSAWDVIETSHASSPCDNCFLFSSAAKIFLAVSCRSREIVSISLRVNFLAGKNRLYLPSRINDTSPALTRMPRWYCAKPTGMDKPAHTPLNCTPGLG